MGKMKRINQCTSIGDEVVPVVEPSFLKLFVLTRSHDSGLVSTVATLNVDWGLLTCEETEHRGRHRLHMNLKCVKHTLVSRRESPSIEFRDGFRPAMKVDFEVHRSKTETHLANRSSKKVNNFLVRNSHNALAVDLNDSVSHADTATFGDTSTE